MCVVKWLLLQTDTSLFPIQIHRDKKLKSPTNITIRETQPLNVQVQAILSAIERDNK